MNEKFFEKKQSIDKEFVDKIITSIEQNTPIFQMPWKGSDLNQTNPATGTVYSGINFLRLFLTALEKGYLDNRWLTMANIKDKGYHLEKGSKGVPIYKYVSYDKLTKKSPDWETIKKLSKIEQIEYINENIKSGLAYSGTVFNASCINGIEKITSITAEEKLDRELKANKKIETILKNSEAPLKFTQNNEAYYSLTEDIIYLPNRDNFFKQEGFYAVALHEIAHSTGHKTRLNRTLAAKYGSEDYAREEMRAELSSLFLSVELGHMIEPLQKDNHIAYLASWIKVLKKDHLEFYKAANDAQKITTWLKENYLKKELVPKPSTALEGMILDSFQNSKKILEFSQINISNIMD